MDEIEVVNFEKRQLTHIRVEGNRLVVELQFNTHDEAMEAAPRLGAKLMDKSKPVALIVTRGQR